MIPITAAHAAEKSRARLVGDGTVLVGPDVVIDSRAVTPGALFVAVAGERNDGHDYVPQAVAAGAAAVLVTHELPVSVPQLVVSDVVAAMTELAKTVVAAGKNSGLRVLALTGSSGKTSTKDMLAQILETVGPTVSPVNSLNNATGMPLTALRVAAETKFLVSEMGASHVGEIAKYAKVAPPDVAAVLNVGLAHLGEFGSREHIAVAKSEIVEALDVDGWAILNSADPLVAAMAARTTAHVGWFGTEDAVIPADAEFCLNVRDLSMDSCERGSFTLLGRGPDGDFSFPVTLQFVGEHMVANAAAAAAMALAVGVEPERVALGLNAARPRSRWRMELHQLTTGTLIINDAYNANPLSVQAALNAVGKLKAERMRAGEVVRLTVVLGDMLELGDESQVLHYEVGRQAAVAGADTVIAVGEYAADIVAGTKSFVERINEPRSDAATLSGVCPERVTAVVATKDEVSALLPHSATDIVLLKGSHSVGLEAVADGLIARLGEVSS